MAEIDEPRIDDRPCGHVARQRMDRQVENTARADDEARQPAGGVVDESRNVTRPANVDGRSVVGVAEWVCAGEDAETGEHQIRVTGGEVQHVIRRGEYLLTDRCRRRGK